jgi:hypothetical protein
VVWTVSGGVPSALGATNAGSTAKADGSDLTFVQISDTQRPPVVDVAKGRPRQVDSGWKDPLQVDRRLPFKPSASLALSGWPPLIPARSVVRKPLG